MKLSKGERQATILRLIRERPIETQEELVECLNGLGHKVTQATVSRDIRELGIVKSTGGGRNIYMTMSSGRKSNTDRLFRVFAQAVISHRTAANLVVIKTLPGMAQAGASALDAMDMPHIVGTLAGDDTIFIATPSNESAEYLNNMIPDLSLSSEAEE
ncbi:MAG: arginine repressor [Clostridiaceae bacterium]|nr:arginine repressor [Clostridiaceae bacterium]